MSFYPRRSARTGTSGSGSGGLSAVQTFQRQIGRYGVQGQKQATQRNAARRPSEAHRRPRDRARNRRAADRETKQDAGETWKPGSLEASLALWAIASDAWTPGDSRQADKQTSRQQTAARRNNSPSGNPDAASGGALPPRVQQPSRSPTANGSLSVRQRAILQARSMGSCRTRRACRPAARPYRALSLPDRGGGPGTAEQCGEVTARAIACACASVDDDDASLWRSTGDTVREAGPVTRCWIWRRGCLLRATSCGPRAAPSSSSSTIVGMDLSSSGIRYTSASASASPALPSLALEFDTINVHARQMLRRGQSQRDRHVHSRDLPDKLRVRPLDPGASL